MTDRDKVIFYNKYQPSIHPLIKSNPDTKPKWRKLFWTTGRDSNQYKVGCVEILKEYFPYLFTELNKEVSISHIET